MKTTAELAAQLVELENWLAGKGYDDDSWGLLEAADRLERLEADLAHEAGANVWLNQQVTP